jgi:hypothetical protein
VVQSFAEAGVADALTAVAHETLRCERTKQ